MHRALTNNFDRSLKKIADVDFDKFYTFEMRILLHLLMWFFFAIILYLNYFIEFRLSQISCLLLTIRAIVNNAIVFYFFFYLFPVFFYSNKIITNIIFLITGLFLCVVIWLLINYLQLLLIFKAGFEVMEQPFTGIIKKNATQGIDSVLSVKTIIGNANTVIFSFLPPFFVKILFDIIRLYASSLKIEKQKAKLEIQNINIEKDFLKAQLNPHFLFNTLNNLYGLTVKKDSKASEVILNLSDVIAYTLYESNAEKVPLTKELEFIENYFELEKMRYEGKRIQLQVLGKENAEGLYIAPLLTFTFIENAFKYGLKDMRNSFLQILIQITDNSFFFILKNDKEGNKFKQKHTNLGGIGVENAKKRLNLIYPTTHILEINETEIDFEVSLKIKLDK